MVPQLQCNNIYMLMHDMLLNPFVPTMHCMISLAPRVMSFCQPSQLSHKMHTAYFRARCRAHSKLAALSHAVCDVEADCITALYKYID